MKHRLRIGQKGRKWVFFERIGSTNVESVKNSAAWNLQSGDVVYTAYQDQGLGQRGKSWHQSPQENVAMTYFFVPQMNAVGSAFYMNMAVSLAVSEVMESHGISARIKWPNDIYVGHQKICGILIQNILKGKQIDQSHIGLGINVGQKVFPRELPNPTSMILQGVESPDPEEIAQQMAHALDEKLEVYNNGSWSQIKDSYHERLFGKGEPHIFTINGEHKEGTIIGVRENGFLLLDIDGSQEAFQFGQIAYGKSGIVDDRR